MINDSPRIARSLLASAREGAAGALGDLLEGCRSYLLLVAASQLSERVRSKSSPSDLVQQTFLEARRDFSRFDGQSPEAFVGWLRRVLENNIADEHRRYERVQQRSVEREQALPANSSWNGDELLVDSQPTPQAEAMSREEQAILDTAIAALPEEAQRVIHLRHSDQLTWDQIGQQIGKEGEAARKIWSRAVFLLKRQLAEHGQ